KTLQTFPGGKPLKNRRNIILSTDPSYKVEGAEVVHSVEEAVALCQDLASEDVYVFGGGTVYKAFLPYCDTAYITALDYAYSADTFMPNLDQDPEWEMTEESDEQTYFNVIYSFKTYRRK
ncbi:MAG: dihydrofolate reductase, partial [Lachnospiraceae bacterium]|nr:dihydrofolate reductase [Candidatus Equihabitans merdae]